MANPRTPPPANADHWNSGTPIQRAVYSVFEQVAHAAGMRAGKTGAAKGMADSVLGRFAGAPNAIAMGGATAAAATLINADFFANALANKLGLPRDRVVELANEGLDEFVRGTIVGASQLDPSMPIEDQNRELRRIAEERFGIYVNEVARRNAHLLREVILAPVDGVMAWHVVTCPHKSSLVGRDGVRKMKWFERPKRTVRAACVCQETITFKGTLNEVFDHLVQEGSGAMVDEVLAVVATDEFKNVRDEFMARANSYDQATVGMVERALKATDPAIRHGLFLELVGIMPKTGAEGVAEDAVKKGKEFLKQISDPNSPVRQQVDTGIKNFGKQGRSFSKAARRRS